MVQYCRAFKTVRTTNVTLCLYHIVSVCMLVISAEPFRTKGVTADTDRSSQICLWCRAFQNSRSLAQQGAALLLLSILKRGHLSAPATVAAICAAVKKLAANEDICKELAEEGAVQATMQVGPARHTCMQVWQCLEASIESKI